MKKSHYVAMLKAENDKKAARTTPESPKTVKPKKSSAKKSK